MVMVMGDGLEMMIIHVDLMYMLISEQCLADFSLHCPLFIDEKITRKLE